MAKKRFYGLISLLVTIALRAVNTSDFMTATWAKVPYEVLEVVSSRIVKEVEGTGEQPGAWRGRWDVGEGLRSQGEVRGSSGAKTDPYWGVGAMALHHLTSWKPLLGACRS